MEAAPTAPPSLPTEATSTTSSRSSITSAPSPQFEGLFGAPAQALPVIIGEFGPYAASSMTLDDTARLMEEAEALGVPYLAWTFHHRCPPNLIVEYSSGCGVELPLEPTPWGEQLMERLARPAR